MACHRQSFLNAAACVRQEDKIQKREGRTSVRVTFEGHLPRRVYHESVCYRVTPYERAPFRQFWTQACGHVAAICRRVRRCGKDNCNVEKCTSACTARGITIRGQLSVQKEGK